MSEYKYQSPIEIIQGEMGVYMDGEILKAVQNVGINVDKDELLKALAYDRDQYNKGYHDAEPKAGRWISVSSFEAFGGDEICWEIRGNPTAFHYCSNCKEQAYVDEFGNEILSKYCPNCGAKMERRIGERKKITIEHNICPKPECGDEFPIPKEGWKGVSDEHID